MKEINVLITGAGAPGAPGIIKSLRVVKERKIRIIGVDFDIINAIGVGLVDVVYSVPSATSPDFIKSILDICITENVDVVIPLVTKELFEFSKSKDLFLSKNINVIISDFDKLTIANNKYELMSFCQKNEIPAPKFFLVKTVDEFVNRSRDLGYPDNTICFKPPISNGLRGFRIISDSTNKMDSLINEKPNNVFIGFEEFLQIAKDSSYFPELLLMEYLPGEEYSVDILAKKGRCLMVVPRSRDKIKMGISFVGTVTENKDIIEYSKKLVEKLGLEGNIGLQFKYDSNGIPKIIESNPRVQGTIVLCSAAGANLIYGAVKVALGEEPDKFDIKWGTKMVRFWDELFFDQNGESIYMK